MIKKKEWKKENLKKSSKNEEIAEIKWERSESEDYYWISDQKASNLFVV
jgi:hypothetical protein